MTNKTTTTIDAAYADSGITRQDVRDWKSGLGDAPICHYLSDLALGGFAYDTWTIARCAELIAEGT